MTEITNYNKIVDYINSCNDISILKGLAKNYLKKLYEIKQK